MPLEMLILIPYVTTLAAEFLTALLWGYRKPADFGILFLVNTITNLSLNALLLVLRLRLPVIWTWGCTIGLEVIIFFVEAFLFRRFLSRCEHPYLFSLAANAASFTAGLIVSALIL